MRALLLSSAASAAALLPLAARAADDPPLSELVVTATRLPAAIDQVTGAHVIDRAELEARQTPFVQDVLRTVPGVTVTDNGAFGGISAIRIRGATADKTLVLIDGVPVGDPADPNGTYDASALQSLDIERIEVLEGPQGSLWGSDAIGGVVAITTREIDGLRGEAEGGSLGTARGFLGAGTSQDRYAVSATLAGLRTDGISKADTGTERDPFRTASASLAGRVKLSDALQLAARLRYAYANIAIDGFPPPDFTLADTPDRDKSRSWQGDARAIYQGALGLTHTLSVADYHLWRRDISDFPALYTADRRVWRWTAEHGRAADPYAFVLGAERMETHADLSGRASADLSTTAAFAVGRARPWAPLTLTGSLRWDDPDRFKSRVSARAAAEIDVGEGFTLTASAGQGFKVPSISEVVCDFCFAPPVPLRPERAEGYDLRLGWRSPDGRLSAALTGFRLNVRDQIAFVGPRYVNIARTRSQGLQAEADAKLAAGLQLKLAYARTEAVDRSTGEPLLRVPRDTGSAALFWDRGPWQAALTARAESSQPDIARDGFSRLTRKGFVTADFAGSYRLSEAVSLIARIENLADKRYEEVFGFNEPGRTAFIGVRFRN
ncbi:MAG TPA: TonB-dependent receptor [Phenylobacterium sp.]|uniref:TonB-dependent receptor plug domain-containing protein n=1 Tax=Phenylobacterium sp. TaxID=1871053 RepID=UPI002D0FAD42|nr:TonB-dependent receptor [Phenylobacterium sp.]HSV02337.1 TonB-dependent receptor [Phenylobacterium sp.]